MDAFLLLKQYSFIQMVSVISSYSLCKLNLLQANKYHSYAYFIFIYLIVISFIFIILHEYLFVTISNTQFCAARRNGFCFMKFNYFRLPKGFTKEFYAISCLCDRRD